MACPGRPAHQHCAADAGSGGPGLHRSWVAYHRASCVSQSVLNINIGPAPPTTITATRSAFESHNLPAPSSLIAANCLDLPACLSSTSYRHSPSQFSILRG